MLSRRSIERMPTEIQCDSEAKNSKKFYHLNPSATMLERYKRMSFKTVR